MLFLGLLLNQAFLLREAEFLFRNNILLSPCAQKHANECQKVPVDCSNGCGQVIKREEVKSAHTEQNRLVVCFVAHS